MHLWIATSLRDWADAGDDSRLAEARTAKAAIAHFIGAFIAPSLRVPRQGRYRSACWFAILGQLRFRWNRPHWLALIVAEFSCFI